MLNPATLLPSPGDGEQELCCCTPIDRQYPPTRTHTLLSLVSLLFFQQCLLFFLLYNLSPLNRTSTSGGPAALRTTFGLDLMTNPACPVIFSPYFAKSTHGLDHVPFKHLVIDFLELTPARGKKYCTLKAMRMRRRGWTNLSSFKI